jgi:hypothetical protein
MRGESFQRAVQLFNNREFFECHEALEEVWMPERGARRLFLQGLIHLTVGFHHSQRGNLEGASRQLRKGLYKLNAYLPTCEGIDTARLYQEVLSVLDRVEAGGVVAGYPQIHTSSGSSSQ